MQAHAEMMSKSTSAETMANTPATEANLPKSLAGERHREEVGYSKNFCLLSYPPEKWNFKIKTEIIKN